MNIEEIKSLNIKSATFEIRVGRALTVIDSQPNGKSVGRDIVLRNKDELDALISALSEASKWLQKEFKHGNELEQRSL